MSQRKEKYLRRALKKCDKAEERVEALSEKTDVMDIRLDMMRKRQNGFEKELMKRRRETGKHHRKEMTVARNALVMSVAAIALAAVAVVAALVPARAEEVKLPETPEPVSEVAQVYMAPVRKLRTEETVDKQQERYSEAVPLTEEEQRQLRNAAAEFNVPYHIALGLVEVESSFRNITGDSGDSVGYMQVQPRWHKERMAQLGVADVQDPEGNFRVGLSYLAEQLQRYGDLHKALMAYNMGPTGAAKVWERGETQSAYSRKVITCAQTWENELQA